MLKFGRKTKKASLGKPDAKPDELPIQEQVTPAEQDVDEEDKITAMAPAYSMPSTMPTNFSESNASPARRSRKKTLPPLFLYIEEGDFQHAKERARKHPREVKTWATIKIKNVGHDQPDSTKRLALHQACFKVSSGDGDE